MTHVVMTNRAITTLSGAISAGATSLVLAPGTGALFPNPAAGQFFALSLTDAATGFDHEIVYVTARVGDTLTIMRGQEGTAAQPWLAGDKAANQLTAGTLQYFVQLDQLTPLSSGAYAIDTGTADQAEITLSPAPGTYSDLYGAMIRVKKVGLPNTGTGLYTINANSLGPVRVVFPDGADPQAAELVGSGIFTVVFNGSTFEIQSPSDVTPVYRGGTGRQSLTSGYFLLGGGTGPVSVIASPIDVPHGGTGQVNMTAYGVLAGKGTASVDWSLPSATPDLPLCSNGSAALATFRFLNLNTAVTGKLPLANSPLNPVVDGSAAPGSHTFTVGANTYFLCGCVVGGGGGGAAGNGTYDGGGGGAGGIQGGPVMGWFAVMPGDVVSYTVGAGGVGGTSGGNGTAGGTSSIGAVLSATGGDGGKSVSSAAGGDGGLGASTAGIFNAYGGQGDDGSANIGKAGMGGTSFFGGGSRSHAGSGSGSAAPGAGGGGGYGSVDGYPGLPGIVLVWG